MKKNISIVQPIHFINHLAGASQKELKIILCRMGNSLTWQTEPRSLPDHIIWYISQGELRGYIEKDDVTVTQNTFFLISPKARHAFHSVKEKGNLMNYSLRFILTKNGKLLRLNPSYIAPKSFPIGKSLLHQLYLNETFPNPLRFQKMRALLTTLFIELFNHGEPPIEANKIFFGPRQIHQLDKYVSENIHLNPSPADLAHLFTYSPDYFSRIFRKQFGISPREWLKNERLHRAALLLTDTSDSIKEIAHKLGFEDQRFFSKQFKKRYALSPKAYRLKTYSAPA